KAVRLLRDGDERRSTGAEVGQRLPGVAVVVRPKQLTILGGEQSIRPSPRHRDRIDNRWRQRAKEPPRAASIVAAIQRNPIEGIHYTSMILVEYDVLYSVRRSGRSSLETGADVDPCVAAIAAPPKSAAPGVTAREDDTVAVNSESEIR